MHIPIIDQALIHDVRQQTANHVVHSTRLAEPSKQISLDDLAVNPHIEAKLKRKIKRNAEKLGKYKIKVLLFKFDNNDIQVQLVDQDTGVILSVFEGKRLENLLDSLDTLVGLLLDITL